MARERYKPRTMESFVCEACRGHPHQTGKQYSKLVYVIQLSALMSRGAETDIFYRYVRCHTDD